MNQAKGFTLIEIMLALLIFAIVATLAITGLRNILYSSALIHEHNDRLTNIQLTEVLMGRDFAQVVARSIKVNQLETHQAILGDQDHVALTHMGYENPMAQFPRGTLQRTEYLFENHEWLRRTWPVLDRTDDTPESTRVLLSNVDNVSIAYIDDKRHETDTWEANALPAAIEVSITLHDMGSLNRLYLIKGNGNAD